MKKIISLLLSATMILTLAITAFATDATTEDKSGEASAIAAKNENAYAAQTEHAYSIGHNFGGDIPLIYDLEGDFTISAEHASTIYGMLGYNSYYNFNPTYSYLRGTNPSGVDRLGSSIVYINGHANYDNILCGDYVDDDNHKCGVYYKGDFTSSKSGFTYAGLEDRDLTGVKLFTFVGCYTAQKDVNLCTKALDGGATCVVGFNDAINGLTTEGQNWKKAYNNSLGNGSTVSEAISYATRTHPNCDLGDYAQTYGDADISITLNNVRSMLARTNSEVETEVERKKIPVENAFFDFSAINNGEYIELEEVESECADIIKIMVEAYPQFDISKYKILANGYDDDSGIIKVRYFIDDIETSSVVVFTVVDGTIVNYSVAYADSLRENLAESQVTLAKSVFEEKNVEVMNSVATGKAEPEYDIVSDEFYYYYNFEDDTLYYVSSAVYAVFGTNACSSAETRTFVKKF